MGKTDKNLLKVLADVRDKKVPVEQAYEVLKDIPYEDLCHTKVDHHRALRRGLQEVIFGQGKSLEQIVDIAAALLRKNEDALVTRVDETYGRALKEKFPGGLYDKTARCFVLKKAKARKTGKGTILIVSAGTSDIPVAEEAYATAVFFGNKTEKLYDVGVAGIHRILGNIDILKKARVIIVVAGMEGALPSVVGGLVDVPVIGVPTSVGYGASFGGLAALLGMLNSCSTVSVFNIDNGFGAAYYATLINRL